VRDYLAVQEVAVRDGSRRLRAGDAEAVHPTRVAIRRFRSTLRTFAPMFDRPAAGVLSERLREYAGLLGGVRDLQVLAGVIAEHSSEELHAHLRPRLAAELSAAWSQLELALQNPEYAGLLGDVDAFLLGPGSGHGKAAKRVAKAVSVAEKKLAKAGDDTDLLHAARKAAKRARYAAEATGDSSTVERWKAVQDHLGTHHDCVVAADWTAGSQAHADLSDLRSRLRETAEAALDRVRK